jgi:hypothetical protein
MPQMPRPLLNILVACSLCLATILFSGYFSRFGFRIDYPSPPIHVAFVEALEEEGRIAIWYERLPCGTGYPARLTVNCLGPDLRAPKPDRALWQFDSHWMAGQGHVPFLFAFPIWCLLLPSLILPIGWIRRRRKPDMQGFPVTQRELPPTSIPILPKLPI